MEPIVTIVVTVYRRTDYLREALESALAQSFRAFEIIVTDDSRSDAIRAICESFGRPEIRYRTNADTLGVAMNLRAAIAEARGRYVAVLNDDDAWEPAFLERLVGPLEADGRRALAFSDHWIVSAGGKIDERATDENTARYGRLGLPAGEVRDLDRFVLEQNGVPLAMAALFRKDALAPDALVAGVRGAYDFWLACLLAATGRPAYYVPARLTRYRLHEAMETARHAPDKQENMVFLYRALLDRGLFPSRRALLARRYSEALRQVGRDNLRFDQPRPARGYFRESLAEDGNGKAVVGLLISYLPRRLRVALGITR